MWPRSPAQTETKRRLYSSHSHSHGERQSHKDAEYALEERVVAIQEEYFGIHYPYAKLDLVAVPDFKLVP